MLIHLFSALRCRFFTLNCGIKTLLVLCETDVVSLLSLAMELYDKAFLSLMSTIFELRQTILVFCLFSKMVLYCVYSVCLLQTFKLSVSWSADQKYLNVMMS